ncbi:putative protein (DUF3310 domain) [Campylobacter iguaniorum]|uniref:DUF3310 domain-containing protein n=1 Tax=Campylobacter iguaniorum TaxID=1244531 RepID=UPI00073A71C9|nr:DUF3310 domain-containing protein [Campylobacter iguaniorum]ALV25076.1 putative protein (DUF3310 domain) [Campylobacter iguaniorum]
MSDYIKEKMLGKETQAISEILSHQVGGDHYAKMTIQPIEFIIGNQLDFCQGNIIKYICRYKDKNGLEDLQKAKHYIDILIEQNTK